MSITKSVMGSILVLSMVVFVFSSTSDRADVAQINHEETSHTTKSSINTAVAASFEHDVDVDDMYFDCLADNPVECREEYMPEESGCDAHKVCVDRCLEEGAGHLCYADCDAMYLGIGSLDPESDVCGCELCAQACSEQCYNMYL